MSHDPGGGIRKYSQFYTKIFVYLDLCNKYFGITEWF